MISNFLNTMHFTKAHRDLSRFLTLFCCSFCLLTSSVNNFRTYRASWETNSRSVTQQIPCVVCDTKVHYRVHKSPACVSKCGIENCDIRVCLRTSQSKCTYSFTPDRVLFVLPNEAFLTSGELYCRTVTPPVVHLPVLIVQPSCNCGVCPCVRPCKEDLKKST